jgi:tRNA (guanine-N7-)-methyltransferase
MDWSIYYPAFVTPQDEAQVDSTLLKPEITDKGVRKLVKDVEVADIGCGFGGLLVALAPKLPDKLLLGKMTKELLGSRLTYIL